MHDDVLLRSPKWERELTEKFYKEDNVALAYPNELVEVPLQFGAHHGLYNIKVPQLQTEFLACKKKWYMKAGVRLNHFIAPRLDWDQYYEFFYEDIDPEFFSYYERLNMRVAHDKSLTTEPINFVFQDIGAWLYYHLCQNGNTFVKIDSDVIVHLKHNEFGLSRAGNRQEILDSYKGEIDAVEEKVLLSEYGPIYKKYLEA